MRGSSQRGSPCQTPPCSACEGGLLAWTREQGKSYILPVLGIVPLPFGDEVTNGPVPTANRRGKRRFRQRGHEPFPPCAAFAEFHAYGLGRHCHTPGHLPFMLISSRNRDAHSGNARGLEHGDQVRISGDDAHYLAHVLRLAVGDRFQVVVPAAQEYRVVAEQISGDCVVGRIVHSVHRHTEPQLVLTLYQAILKGKSFPLVIQKAVELGVTEIVPVITGRTVVRLSPDGLPGRRERWQRIATEAAEQSERTSIPQIHLPLPLGEAVKRWQAIGHPGLVFAARATGRDDCNLRNILTRLGPTHWLTLFVGPEGGFTAQEVEMAVTAGLQEASLGRRILRAETAALLACGLSMYELDEFAPPDEAEAREDP